MKKISRRSVIQKGAAFTLAGGLTGLMRGMAQGSKLKIGFIALTDAAPAIMAGELGLFKKYGLDVEVTKEASWATVRDRVLNGELNAAHCLFGMPLSVHMGIGGPAGRVMPIGLVFNTNGQAITLSNQDFGGKVGFKDLEGAGKAILAKKAENKPLTFAMTFPGGTHDLWLRYWLGAAGVSPVSDVKVITIPPPQMVANMSVGNMDGYCVGEPWNGVAVKQGIGFTTVATQDVWKHHSEKALVFNNEFYTAKKDEAKAMAKAILEACKWLDNIANRREAAKVIAQRQYVNAPADVIDARLQGVYEMGSNLGKKNYTDDYMLFHKGGSVNVPRKSHAIWFLAQYKRWGMVKGAVEYQKVADAIIQDEFYKEVARDLKIAVPNDDMQPLTGFIDGVVFDPKNPEASIAKYKIKEV
jgi:nitrate/nitrite transport system substrate-binding protein